MESGEPEVIKPTHKRSLSQAVEHPRRTAPTEMTFGPELSGCSAEVPDENFDEFMINDLSSCVKGSKLIEESTRGSS